MFHALLTTVLTAIIALQHGICFGHYVDAFVAQNEAAREETPPCKDFCCDVQQPTSPTKSTARPTQNHDEEDNDCPCCKLRQSLAYTPVRTFTEQDDGVPFVLI